MKQRQLIFSFNFRAPWPCLTLRMLLQFKVKINLLYQRVIDLTMFISI